MNCNLFFYVNSWPSLVLEVELFRKKPILKNFMMMICWEKQDGEFLLRL